MKVLITGGTGFIGAHLVRAFVDAGHAVTVLARSDEAARVAAQVPGVGVVRGDLEAVPQFADSLHGHDVCIHNALIWDDEPTELQMKDTVASIALFEAASKAGVEHFIYTSSIAVHRPFRAGMLESDALHPTDTYGATKLCTEVFLGALSRSTPMRFNVVRPGPTVGPPVFAGGPFKADRRFESIVRSAQSGEAISFRRGEARQFVDVRDLADVYLSLALSQHRNEPFIAVGRESHSWEQVANLASQLLGKPIEFVVHEPSTTELAPFAITAKVESLLGRPLDATEGIEDTLRAIIHRMMR